MTRDEALRALEDLNQAIATAVVLIGANRATLDRFFAEQRSMDSIGHIIDPTLFNKSEPRATAALLEPVYRSALALLVTYDAQVTKARSALHSLEPRA